MSIQAQRGDMDLSGQVAEEIRALLARRRISGRELARQLNVSPSWISYRLTGSQPIDLNDAQRIADALGVNVVDLLPRRQREVTVWYPQPSMRLDAPVAVGSSPVATALGVATYQISRPDPARSRVPAQPPPGRHRTAPTGALV